jgi:hypothetical protein
MIMRCKAKIIPKSRKNNFLGKYAEMQHWQGVANVRY